MKKLLLSLIAVLPGAALAEITGDTTVVYNGKEIVINDSAEHTSVTISRRDSDGKLVRTYETSYADGQEIERVYVTSPFIPQSLTKKKDAFRSHYPLFYMGFSMLAANVMGTGGNTGMHSRDSKSWEYGFTLASSAVRISNSLGFTSALQWGQVHHHFQNNYVLSTSDGMTSMRKVEDGQIRKSYISYNVLRVPLMIEWQTGRRFRQVYAAFGPSIELRWNDHSRYFIGKKKYTETGDINMNPVGINLEMRVGCGALNIYGRAALTSLLKSEVAPKCYPVSFGMGVRI